MVRCIINDDDQISLSPSLLIGNACGQDWLDGGYVGSSGGGDIAQYFRDLIFYSNPTSYQFRAGPYPGPYGVYPFNPSLTTQTLD